MPEKSKLDNVINLCIQCVSKKKIVYAYTSFLVLIFSVISHKLLGCLVCIAVVFDELNV